MTLFWTILIVTLLVLTVADAALDRNREPTTNRSCEMNKYAMPNFCWSSRS